MIPTRYLLDDFKDPIDWTTTIEGRPKADGTLTWVIMDFGNVMDKNTGKFEDERSHANRTPDFIARTRFGSAEEALEAYRKIYPERIKKTDV